MTEAEYKSSKVRNEEYERLLFCINDVVKFEDLARIEGSFLVLKVQNDSLDSSGQLRLNSLQVLQAVMPVMLEFISECRAKIEKL